MVDTDFGKSKHIKNQSLRLITGPNLLLISSIHRRNDTELLHHAEIIHTCPNFRDLSVCYAKHIDPLELDSFSRGLYSHELTLVCAVRGPDHCHLVSIGNKVVECEVQAWKATEECLTHFFIPLTILVSISMVYNEVGGEIIVVSSYVLIVPEILCPGSNDNPLASSEFTMEQHMKSCSPHQDMHCLIEGLMKNNALNFIESIIGKGLLKGQEI